MSKRIKKFLLDNNITFVLSVPLYIFRLFKIDNKKIMIINYSGKGYGDNCKYIVEELLKSNNYNIYWAIQNDNYSKSLPQSVNGVKYNSIKYFYHLFTSKVWINNSRFPSYIKKRKKQFYIQTWHSSIRLKKIEADAIEDLSKEYIRSAKNDSKMINILLCGCDYSKNTYENSFWYDGKIVMTGTPKYDPYFDKNSFKSLRTKLLKEFNIKENNKLVLYAPTFRKNNSNFIGTLDCDELIKRPELKDFVILMRLHPNCKNKIKKNNKIIDVTNYPDIQDLIIICDYLVTDYSGCCFDSLVANKKCALFVPDLDEYTSKERGLYFSFEELPFPKIKDINELVKFLINPNDNEYEKKLEIFRKKIGLIEDGKASIKVKNIIDNVIGGKNEKI